MNDGSEWSPERLARALDHTLLRPDAGAADVERLCAEARAHHFATACVHGSWVRRCAQALAGSDVAVCAVVGFPLGAMATRAKAYEAAVAVEDGARELDMVVHLGALRAADEATVVGDVAAVAETVRRGCDGGVLKVILETASLTPEEIVRGCGLAVRGGADFVKTSTGFSGGGATVEAVALMRRAVGPAVGVKASGGIRDRATALAMLAAGADRIGASASVAIVRGG